MTNSLMGKSASMTKISRSLLAGFLMIGALALATAKPAAAQSMPKVGDMAPDFSLTYSDGKDEKTVTLSEYRGKKNVVVAFYIFAFTGG